MFNTYRMKKHVINILLKGVRKVYHSDTKSFTIFDMMVDTYLAMYFVTVCNTFNVNPKNFNTVEELLQKIYSDLSISKQFSPEDGVLVERLNNHIFPTFNTLCRFSVDNNLDANMHTMKHLQLLIGNTMIRPVNKIHSRISLMLTSDYFINLMKSIITETAGEAKETGHSHSEAAPGIH
jgi:hypothetical protein